MISERLLCLKRPLCFKNPCSFAGSSCTHLTVEPASSVNSKHCGAPLMLWLSAYSDRGAALSPQHKAVCGTGCVKYKETSHTTCCHYDNQAESFSLISCHSTRHRNPIAFKVLRNHSGDFICKKQVQAIFAGAMPWQHLLTIRFMTSHLYTVNQICILSKFTLSLCIYRSVLNKD